MSRFVDAHNNPIVGWTCFHCGETFTTPGSAKVHFGMDPSHDPACRIKIGAELGLVMELRKAQEKLAEYYAEDSAIARSMHGMIADHRAALIQAEQEGYDKGLRESKGKGYGEE